MPTLLGTLFKKLLEKNAMLCSINPSIHFNPIWRYFQWEIKWWARRMILDCFFFFYKNEYVYQSNIEKWHPEINIFLLKITRLEFVKIFFFKIDRFVSCIMIFRQSCFFTRPHSRNLKKKNAEPLFTIFGCSNQTF